MKIDALIRERERLRAEWQSNSRYRAHIEARLDQLTHEIASLAGLGGLLDMPSLLAGGLMAGRRQRKRIF